VAPDSRGALQRIAGGLLIGASLLVAIATLRLLLDGRRNWQAAERFIAAGRPENAAVSLENAAKAYVPGSPYPVHALNKLILMAKGAEMRGEKARSLALWQSVRRSILATRHLVQPRQDILGRAEAHLERIRSSGKVKGRDQRSPMVRPRDPDPFISLLLFFGLASWIAGSAAICVLPPRSRSRRPRLNLAAWIACLGGLGLWIAMAWIAE
jgi:hypothetical protein